MKMPAFPEFLTVTCSSYLPVRTQTVFPAAARSAACWSVFHASAVVVPVLLSLLKFPSTKMGTGGEGPGHADVWHPASTATVGYATAPAARDRTLLSTVVRRGYAVTVLPQSTAEGRIVFWCATLTEARGQVAELVRQTASAAAESAILRVGTALSTAAVGRARFTLAAGNIARLGLRAGAATFAAVIWHGATNAHAAIRHTINWTLDGSVAARNDHCRQEGEGSATSQAKEPFAHMSSPSRKISHDFYQSKISTK